MMLFEPSPSVKATITLRLNTYSEATRPVWRAVALQDCAMAIVPQDAGRFTLSAAHPMILLVGDDTNRSKGVRAFSARSLRAFLPRCRAVAIVSSAPTFEVYSALARIAGDDRLDVAIIETLPQHEGEWLAFVEREAPKASVVLCTVKGEGGLH